MTNKHYLYHIKPNPIQGNHLMPLSSLRVEHPDLYAEAFRKYAGREILTQKKVSILNCLWNDVVHLSPILPSIIRTTIESIQNSPLPDRVWLRIPPEKLQGLPSVYYSNRPSTFGQYDFSESCFTVFDYKTYKELTCLPEWTIQYYKEELSAGRRPFLFNGAQHVLVKGKLSLEEVEEFVW